MWNLIKADIAPSSNVVIVNFDQVSAYWDKNHDNSDGISHDEFVDRSDFRINSVLFFKKIGGQRPSREGRGLRSEGQGNPRPKYYKHNG